MVEMENEIDHSDIINLIERCQDHRYWNYEFAYGDTRREKLESLYVMICNAKLHLEKQGDVVVDILVADKVTADIFDRFLNYNQPYYFPDENKDVERVFKLNNKWLFKDRLLDGGLILVTQHELKTGIVIKHDSSFWIN